jgi:hypothetical protein
MPITLEKYELLFVHPIVLKCLKSWCMGVGGDDGGWFYAKLPTLSKKDFESKQ